jgi:hypothetical protein
MTKIYTQEHNFVAAPSPQSVSQRQFMLFWLAWQKSLYIKRATD